MGEQILVVLFGLVLGSFLNVCIHRLPRNKSIISPGSSCSQCGHRLRWYENIPLLSYLLLRGRCTYCRKKISLRYPAVEVLTALALAVLYTHFGLTLAFFKYGFFFCMLILVSFIDIDYHAIPATLCFLGIVAGLAIDLAVSILRFRQGQVDLSSLPISHSFRGLVFALGFTYLFKFFGDILMGVYLSLRKKESIEGETESLGLGDVDFMGMVGVFLGSSYAVLVFFLAPVFAVIYSIGALMFRRSHLIPYLPYLSLAAVVAFFWGQKIISLLLY
ncbi:MAG: hypothetical protein GF333_07790 [Candidatus Omnitrophica bacterium]|nr:hypothetical protein [Candidatus Omnitrophota bacterium]